MTKTSTTLLHKFADILLHWYEKNQRELPWRQTKDPYKIWLSEVILQQTRVQQGLPYYLKFAEKYPTIAHMAAASEQDILRMWQGLGYYSRARNMYKTAQHIEQNLKGIFPNAYTQIKKLKGVGDYTAAAIASFAYNEKIAVVDSNVYRVLARVFGLKDDIALSKSKKIFTQLAQVLISDRLPRVYNQAIMEFGALHCKPAQPQCPNCPLANWCVAFREKRQHDLPVKSRNIKIKRRFFYYFVFQYYGQLLMQLRIKKDIWQGLYDFYHIETNKKLSSQEVLAQMSENTDLKKNTYESIKISHTYKHLLTHRQILATFFLINIKIKDGIRQLIQQENLAFFTLEQVQNLPKPILIKNYLERNIF